MAYFSIVCRQTHCKNKTKCDTEKGAKCINVNARRFVVHINACMESMRSSTCWGWSWSMSLLWNFVFISHNACMRYETFVRGTCTNLSHCEHIFFLCCRFYLNQVFRICSTQTVYEDACLGRWNIIFFLRFSMIHSHLVDRVCFFRFLIDPFFFLHWTSSNLVCVMWKYRT